MAHIYEIVLVVSYILGFVYMFKIAKSVDSRRQFAVIDKVPVNGYPFALFFAIIFAIAGALQVILLGLIELEFEFHISVSFVLNIIRHLQFLLIGFMMLTILLSIMTFYADFSKIARIDKIGLLLTTTIMVFIFINLKQFPWAFVFLAAIFCVIVAFARQSQIEHQKAQIRARNQKRKEEAAKRSSKIEEQPEQDDEEEAYELIKTFDQ